MFSDMEALELLSRGHALEWTGKVWKISPESEHAAAIRLRDKRAAEVAWLIGAPATAVDTNLICAGSRMVALLHETGANRVWC